MEGNGQGRRRRRRGPKRRRVVQFSLDDGEYAELEEAAARDGLSRGAYAADAALAAARGQGGPQVPVLRPHGRGASALVTTTARRFSSVRTRWG
ncbi:hypothetical protein [Microbispora sp. CA-102843]|uniref:hypothetical protein n=1 Tax=Microbispora sp. CA-102843 TaxID=3239952 RepID=UPI003D941610